MVSEIRGEYQRHHRLAHLALIVARHLREQVTIGTVEDSKRDGEVVALQRALVSVAQRQLGVGGAIWQTGGGSGALSALCEIEV